MTEPDDPTGALPDNLADWHALVDGQLPPERLDAVLASLRQHPEDALRVLAWQAQRQALRRQARELTLPPMPTGLAAAARQWAAAAQPEARTTAPVAPPAAAAVGSSGAPKPAPAPVWPRALAAGLLMLAGGLIGAFTMATRQAPGGFAAAEPRFARQAVAAHVVYTPETRHPVEVGAAEEAHLVAWLSRRLGAPLKVPVLQDRGFRLLGGRLLAGDDGGPRAQFMYEDERGRRLTLYVTRFDDGRRPTDVSFRAISDGPVESFYWVEGSFGYALSAPLPAADVMALARSVYGQLAPRE